MRKMLRHHFEEEVAKFAQKENKTIFIKYLSTFNPLQPGVAFLFPLKTSENLKVF